MVNEREDAMNRSRIDVEDDRAGNEPEPRDDGLTHDQAAYNEEELRIDAEEMRREMWREMWPDKPYQDLNTLLLDIYRTATGTP